MREVSDNSAIIITPDNIRAIQSPLISNSIDEATTLDTGNDHDTSSVTHFAEKRKSAREDPQKKSARYPAISRTIATPRNPELKRSTSADCLRPPDRRVGSPSPRRCGILTPFQHSRFRRSRLGRLHRNPLSSRNHTR